MNAGRAQYRLWVLVLGMLLWWAPLGGQWMAHGAEPPDALGAAHCLQDQGPCQAAQCDRCCTACLQCAQAAVAPAAAPVAAPGGRPLAMATAPRETHLGFLLRPPRVRSV